MNKVNPIKDETPLEGDELELARKLAEEVTALQNEAQRVSGLMVKVVAKMLGREYDPDRQGVRFNKDDDGAAFITFLTPEEYDAEVAAYKAEDEAIAQEFKALAEADELADEGE